MSDDPRGVLEILEDSSDLYEAKNDDYGDSWRLIGKTLALWMEHQGMNELRIPATEEHLNSFGLFTRRLDKIIRQWNGWMMMEYGEDFNVDEGIAETHRDSIPYAAMHASLAEKYAYSDPEDLL